MTLQDILKGQYSYEVHYNHLSDYIIGGAALIGEEVPNNLRPAERVEKLQSAGDKLRKACGSPYLAAKAVERIAVRRDKEGFGSTAEGVPVPKRLRQVHVIDSLKYPDELKLLSSIWKCKLRLQRTPTSVARRGGRAWHQIRGDDAVDDGEQQSRVSKDGRGPHNGMPLCSRRTIPEPRRWAPRASQGSPRPESRTAPE